MDRIVLYAYLAGSISTTTYLLFFDGYNYNFWNWIVAIPADLFLGSIWPIYWIILHWIM